VPPAKNDRPRRGPVRARMIEKIRGFANRRSNHRRWIYMLVAVSLVPLAFWSAEESIWGATPCVIVLLILSIQFARPSLLGWGILILIFATYAFAMISQGTRDDYKMGVTFGVLPAICVVLAWPRKGADSANTE